MSRRSGLIFTLIALVFIPSLAEAKQMAVVLNECAQNSEIHAYANCIKERYNKYGNDKKSGDLLIFYSYIDQVVYSYDKSLSSTMPMSFVEAKANVFRAFQSTINASNNREKTRICQMIGNNLECI